MPDQQNAPTVRTERGMATRRALVKAALDAFEAKGVEATSVDEITATAEVAKGTFYVHFQRKQDVLLEWAAELMQDLDISALPTEAPDALRALGQALAEAMMAGGPRLLLGRMVREVVGNSADWLRILGDRATLSAKIALIIERGQQQGTIRSDMTVRRLSYALTNLWLDNVVGWAERAEARPLPDALDLVTDLFLGGAAAGTDR